MMDGVPRATRLCHHHPVTRFTLIIA